MADRRGRVKRLFIAVDIDAATRDQIASTVHTIAVRLKADTTGVRMTWVRPDRLHLTLEFFGDADAALERQILSSLAQPVRVASFDLAFDGIGVFPPKGAPRVLWLGISAGLDDLHRLRAELLRRLGAESGPAKAGRHRVFHPHLTLARFRDGAARLDAAKLTKMDASAGPCRIDRVTLYESHLSPAGPTYSALAQAALIS